MFEPTAYLESAVRDVLTAGEHDPATVDRTVGDAALLLACVGATAECDRLVQRWHEITERPAAALAPDPVSARGFAMLLAARHPRPAWAAELPPIDLTEAERAHALYLRRGAKPDAPGLTAAIVSFVDEPRGPHPLRSIAAAAGDAAAMGDEAAVADALAAWAARAGPRPPVGMLAGCRNLAPLLVDGALADPLGITAEWAESCAGGLIAALHARHPDELGLLTWSELIEYVLSARADADLPPRAAPAPATAQDIAAAERHLGVSLPTDYREFLATCNGLPGDVTFPRLLGVEELRATEGSVVVSESSPAVIVLAAGAGGGTVIEYDPVLGSTRHPNFRALVEHHLKLLSAG